MLRPEVDLDWAKANLIRVWREQAPKRVLKAYDEGVTAQDGATAQDVTLRPIRD